MTQRETTQEKILAREGESTLLARWGTREGAHFARILLKNADYCVRLFDYTWSPLLRIESEINEDTVEIRRDPHSGEVLSVTFTFLLEVRQVNGAAAGTFTEAEVFAITDPFSLLCRCEVLSVARASEDPGSGEVVTRTLGHMPVLTFPPEQSRAPYGHPTIRGGIRSHARRNPQES